VSEGVGPESSLASEGTEVRDAHLALSDLQSLTQVAANPIYIYSYSYTCIYVCTYIDIDIDI